MKCGNCGFELTSEMFISGMCFHCGYDISLSKKLFEDEKQKRIQQQALEKQQAEFEDNFQKVQAQQKQENMILTTTNDIAGYNIVAYCGLVFGDTVFKLGFVKQIDASIDDFFDTLSLRDKELSGSTNMLEQARSYSILKMKEQAFSKGANAVIGVDAETTFGSGVYHSTIFGTAVRIEKKI